MTCDHGYYLGGYIYENSFYCVATLSQPGHIRFSTSIPHCVPRHTESKLPSTNVLTQQGKRCKVDRGIVLYGYTRDTRMDISIGESYVIECAAGYIQDSFAQFIVVYCNEKAKLSSSEKGDQEILQCVLSRDSCQLPVLEYGQYGTDAKTLFIGQRTIVYCNEGYFSRSRSYQYANESYVVCQDGKRMLDEPPLCLPFNDKIYQGLYQQYNVDQVARMDQPRKRDQQLWPQVFPLPYTGAVIGGHAAVILIIALILLAVSRQQKHKQHQIANRY